MGCSGCNKSRERFLNMQEEAQKQEEAKKQAAKKNETVLFKDRPEYIERKKAKFGKDYFERKAAQAQANVKEKK